MDVYGDSRFDDLRYQIVDMRAVKACEINDTHMRQIAHLDMAAARSNSHIRVAVILADHLHDVYAQNTQASHWKTKSFQDYEVALEWAKSNT